MLLAIALLGLSIARIEITIAQDVDYIEQQPPPPTFLSESSEILGPVFNEANAMACQCRDLMRRKHRETEHQIFDIVNHVGTRGDFERIATGRMDWALTFVNFVERMVGEKREQLEAMFADLETRLRLDDRAMAELLALRTWGRKVLQYILLRCRQQVTGTVKAAVDRWWYIRGAAVRDLRRGQDVWWQRVLEADTLAVTEQLHAITEFNLASGLRLLNDFNARFKQIVERNSYQ